jgi:hypothetical protein
LALDWIFKNQHKMVKLLRLLHPAGTINPVFSKKKVK